MGEAIEIGRLEIIRAEERAYHDKFYAEHRLFEPGSWMSKPVRTVVELAERFRGEERLDVLDLGCGAGRNAIPLAETMRGRSGKVVGVDLLESAIDALAANSRRFGVERYVEPVLSDIEHFAIEPESFDLIVAVSALEHLGSEEALERKLREIARGMRPGGAVCLIIGTNTREYAVDDGRELEPMFEVNVPTADMEERLERIYRGWEVALHSVKPLEYAIERGGRPVRLTTDCVTYVAFRRPPNAQSNKE